MPNLIAIDNNNKYFFKSKDIKVFPSSFRGTYKSDTSPSAADITFDPEARLNTEANFILPKNTLNIQGKDSYIIEYNETKNKITFILGGYYFEILNLSEYLSEISNKYIGITLRPVALLSSSDFEKDQFKLDSDRTSKVLGSWIDNSGDILDFLESTNNCYCFTGLKVLDSEDDKNNCSAVLKLFTETGEINYAACLPNITHGEGENTLLHGEGLKAAYPNQTVVGKYNDNKADTLFEVGNGNNDSERSNAFEVCDDFTRINTNMVVNGLLAVRNHIAATGKITSALTSNSDDSHTLVTKSYIDNMIGGISERPPTPPTSNVGDGDNYVASISQSGAQVSSVLKAFTGTITDTATNAPTAAAVKNFVDNKITDLYVSEIGGSSTYIQKISETNGKISATPKSFSSEINATDDSTAPTVKAVYDYIESVRNGLENKMSDEIGSAVGNLGVESSGQAGSYVKAIKQDGGKIEATTQPFDNSISETSTADNAPTSKVVYDFVTESLKSIWLENIGLTNPSNSAGAIGGLKRLILDATYPVGSIYIQYSDREVLTCPIATSLGGTWTRIEAGTFLCAADSGDTSGGIYRYNKTGGSADAVVVSHTHSAEAKTNKTGVSVNNLSKSGWFRIRTMQSNDSWTAPEVDGTVVQSTELQGGSRSSIDYNGKSSPQHVKINLDHSHSVTDSGHSHKINMTSPIDTKGKDIGKDGSGKNLPPYRAVYMWRRKS